MPQFMSDRWPRIISATAILLSLFVAGHQGTLAGRASATPAEEDLRVLAVEFYARYTKEDVDGFMSLWSAESPDAAARKQAAEKFFAEHERIEVANLTIRKLTVDGDKAKAWVDLEIRAVEVKTGKPVTMPEMTRRVLEFWKKAGQWKVWRETSAADHLAAALVAAHQEKERSVQLRIAQP